MVLPVKQKNLLFHSAPFGPTCFERGEGLTTRVVGLELGETNLGPLKIGIEDGVNCREKWMSEGIIATAISPLAMPSTHCLSANTAPAQIPVGWPAVSLTGTRSFSSGMMKAFWPMAIVRGSRTGNRSHLAR